MLIKRIISPICGKAALQRIFETLYLVSLEGMNIGSGADFRDSGERYALRHIEKKLRGIDRAAIFDVGANIGAYSLLLSETFGPDRDIYSFEPCRHAFDALKQNTRERVNIHPCRFGFGDQDARATIHSDAGGSGLASIYSRRMDHYGVYLSQEEDVEIKRIDAFCQEQGISRIGFLKLDVEGHEFKALQGASGMIGSGKIDCIQFEFGQCDIDSRTFLQDFYYLLKDDYAIYRILKNGLREVRGYKETYELFRGTTNYLAIRKELAG